MEKIKITDLSFSYGYKKVIQNLSLEISSEKPVLLLGESGIGKTTLMRLLLGFLKPDSGKIEGIDRNTRIAVMYQEDRLFPQLSVYKNLKLVKKDLSREQTTDILSELRLDKEILDKLPAELSGGMRRRIALIRALIFDAVLLLLDEPFQGLDTENRKYALAAVKKYSEGRPMLVISHEPSDAEALGAKLFKFEEICRKGCEANE